MNFKLKCEIVRLFGHQYPFAAAIGVRESLVSAVIRERVNLKEDEKKRWAESLKVSVETIFS